MLLRTSPMKYDLYPHRFADVVLNSDYELKMEIEDVVQSITFDNVVVRFEVENARRISEGKKPAQGRQSTISAMFKEEFERRGWEVEKNIFGDPSNDLAIDFWKRKVGVDVAFNHRSYIGGDILRIQAGAEVKDMIKVGVYICPTEAFAKLVSPKDAGTMASYERALWYLDNFYQVITAPILLIGLRE
jgi:hypothetical protein